MTRFLQISLVVLSGLLGAPFPAWSQDRQTPPAQYGRLAGEVMQCFREKKYEEAAEKCREMMKLAPEDPMPSYNLGCAEARLGKAAEAFIDLKSAVDKGFGNPAHMREDEDLASLRGDVRFEELLRKAREVELKAGGATYDKGEEIAGVKTVEDFPEGGLRFRVRMSPGATKEKPMRLVVWLHPSGGAMNGLAEQMSPGFAARGFALLVPTQKNWDGWTGEELKRLVDRTLPAAGKIEGIDARKPVLMGYSAGGEAAIALWLGGPGRFGGLLLDAAYPIVQTAPGRFEVVKLPADEAVKETPWLVLVGEKDGGAQVWRRAESEWRKAGVPVRVDYVAGKGHLWLFGGAEVAAVNAWLAEIAAGKMPPLPDIKPPEETMLKRPEPGEDPNAKPEPPEYR